MEGFESMLSRIKDGSVVIEGGYAVGGSIEPDPQLTAAIEESALPTSVLIQTLEADTHSGILMALEEFELAQIIGSAQVITEGSGAAGATVVMEGILRKFWDALVEKIKALGRWLKGIWDKIFKKSEEKAQSPAIKEAIAHIEGRSAAAKDDGKLDEHLNKIREDAKKGVEAAINICGENFAFIEYNKLYNAFTKMTDGMDKIVEDDIKTVNQMLNDAFKNRDLTQSAKDANASWKSNVEPSTSVLGKYSGKDGAKETYKEVGGRLLGKKTESVEEIDKTIDDIAGLNDTSRLRKSETVPTAAEFSVIFKDVESGKLKVEVDRAVSKVTNSLKRLVNMCEDAKKMCDSGKPYDTKVNKALTQAVAILNTEISTITRALNRVWSIVYNASGRYAGIVNRAMKYNLGKKAGATTESTDWQMYMESGDVKEDVPEDDDATGDDGKATTEGYFGGGGYTGGSDTLSSYLNSFV